MFVGDSTIRAWVIAQIYSQENVGDSTNLFADTDNSTTIIFWIHQLLNVAGL